MQPFTSSIPSLEKLADDRRQFIEWGRIAPHVDMQILRSWQRTAPRLNPYAPPHWKVLDGAIFQRTLSQHVLLHTVALPIMEDIHQFTERADALILLLDSTLCVLDMLGKPAMFELAEDIGVERGLFMSESRVGTNAFAIAQVEGIPTWVFGPEHYLDHFQHVSTVAAPIFNLEGGLIGVIGLVEPVEACSVQSLGVATVTAKAIEGQIQAELIRRDANIKATQLSSIMDAIDEGVLAWDSRGIVTHLNVKGSTLLGLRASAVVGRLLTEFISVPKAIAQAAALAEDREDVEARFIVNDEARECIVNYHYIQTDNATLHLAMLRPIEMVRQLVNRQVGAMAHQTVDDLLGRSQAARSMRKQVEAAASARACVLVVGEQGTGKNTVVRAIHNSSARARGPFIAINCRAIPRDLVLPEFLGYEEAFDGAHQRGQPSKFELVNGGTLFLDEIEALPLDMQAALLRVIEVGDVLRIGGKRPVPVDVRILASTSVDLEKKVRDGTFRADLLFRLRSFLIQTTPLRKRTEDIPVIIGNLLTRIGQQMGKSFTVGEEAERVLKAYPWPGNIRELESVIERAVTLTEGSTITLKHLPQIVREKRTLMTASQQTERVYSLMEAEKMAIMRAGRAAEGNLTRTADILGIGRSTLWRKMKTFNLSVEDF